MGEMSIILYNCRLIYFICIFLTFILYLDYLNSSEFGNKEGFLLLGGLKYYVFEIYKYIMVFMGFLFILKIINVWNL